MPFSSRAFTLVDLAGSIGGVTLVVAAAAAFVSAKQAEPGASGGSRITASKLQDATNIRAIEQALIIFAQNNKDQFPLPSEMDISSDTVKGDKKSKDTSANIMSVLIFQGYIPPKTMVSPVENHANIGVMEAYSFASPKAAVHPDKALWDPAFKADFTAPGAHLSYAHMLPHGDRRTRAWSSSFDAATPVLSNRGPQVKGVEYKEENTLVTMRLANPASNTLRFFDVVEPREKDAPMLWRGNVGFADAHVDFVKSKYGDKQTITSKDVPTYKFREERTRPDIAFFDEPDDSKEANTILGIFTKAGEKRADWTAIWD